MVGARHLFALSFLSLMLFSAASTAQTSTGNPATKGAPPTKPTEASQSIDPAALEGRLRRQLQEDARQAALEAAKPTLELAQREHEWGKMLLDVMKNWLALLSLFFVILGVLGFREYTVIRRAAADAKRTVTDAMTDINKATGEIKAATERVHEQESEVKLSSERVKAMDVAIAKSVSDLSTYFEKLPTLERRGILGEPPELPPSDHVARYEEGDIVITMADKINGIAKRDLVEPLVKLGIYWRLIENFPRALARFTRALEIDAGSVEALRGRTGALYVWAAQRGTPPSVKKRLLEDAQTDVNSALNLKPNDAGLFFDQGWIYDELGELEKAVEAYKKGLGIDPKHRNMTYNLACTYTKQGKLSEALFELAKIADTEWEDMQQDDDFRALRESPEFGPRLAELIERGRGGSS
jgi:tetratricopeptide (TPR) repeat protein